VQLACSGQELVNTLAQVFGVQGEQKTSVEKVFEETVQHCCFKSFRVGAT
jgi:hypothetical protein